MIDIEKVKMTMRAKTWKLFKVCITWLALLLIWAVLMTLGGCATPYSSSVTPRATASVSDSGTSATLQMGAMGEFTLVATHCKAEDGVSTGSVVIRGEKATLGNLISGGLGLLAGMAVAP